MKTLPLVFFKSTLVLVDDDPLLLQLIKNQLEESHHVQTFANPLVCKDFLNKNVSIFSQQKYLRGYIELDDYDTVNHMPVDVNIEEIINLKNNPDRHNEISVLVADYYMEELNGIKLCEDLLSLPMKKTLLTGEADHSQAVNAFNEGIINRFLHKGSPQLSENLSLYIQSLTMQYFCEQTSALLTLLEVDKKLPLTDPVFIDFFNNWCKANNIIEFYLIDKNGSFLTVNQNNEVRFFIIHTDASLDNFITNNEDDERMASYINTVAKREKIPFFGVAKESWQVSNEDLSQFFYLPNIIKGREKYYWTVITPLQES